MANNNNKFKIDERPSTATKNSIIDAFLKHSDSEKLKCSQIIQEVTKPDITETEVKNAIKEMINQRVISIAGRRARHKSIEKYRNLDSQYIQLCHLVKFEDYEYDGVWFQIVRVRS